MNTSGYLLSGYLVSSPRTHKKREINKVENSIRSLIARKYYLLITFLSDELISF